MKENAILELKSARIKELAAKEQILRLNEQTEKERTARINAESALQSKLDEALELCEQDTHEGDVSSVVIWPASGAEPIC